MYARSTTFAPEPGDVDAGIAVVRDDVVPALRELPGCVGVSMLVDRGTRGCIVTTAWRTAAELRDSAPRVAPLRDQVRRLLGGRTEVREWEIAVLHRRRRAGDQACVRLIRTRTRPEMVGPQLTFFRDGVLPHLEELPGFCSTSLLIDRTTGDGALATVYESREAMEQAREAAAGLRSRAARRMSTQVLDVAELDLVVSELRVPETV